MTDKSKLIKDRCRLYLPAREEHTSEEKNLALVLGEMISWHPILRILPPTMMINALDLLVAVMRAEQRARREIEQEHEN